MKLASFIFAFFVLILSVTPDSSLNLLQQNNCCDACSDHQPNEAPSGSTCNDLNPFQSCCSSCAGFLAAYFLTEMPLNPVNKIALSSYYQYSYFQFSGDVWQPPKAA